MACCYNDECGEFAVTPALVAPSCRRNAKCCDEGCYPYLPRCTKSPRPKTPPRTPVDDNYPHHYYYRETSPQPRRPRSPPPTRQSSATSSHRCPTCCHPTCKPVKTKYVIPCYRYEDGRIENQPTLLMRRACEVAVGTRPRRKPFVLSSYCADEKSEERRYHAEDEKGNCCIHFERKKPGSETECYPGGRYHHHLEHSYRDYVPCHTSASLPQNRYNDCYYSRVVGPEFGCYYV